MKASALWGLTLATLGLVLVSLAPAFHREDQDVRFVHNVVPLGGELLSITYGDVDADGSKDVLAALRLEDGRREIHVFLTRPSGSVPAVPDEILEVKSATVSWGVGEFRPDDPGCELLFLSREGAYSFSPRSASYKGNLQKISSVEMLLDMPSDRALPLWSAIADLDGDGVDEVALVGHEGFHLVQVDGTSLGHVPLRVLREQSSAMEFNFKVDLVPAVSSQPLSDLFVPGDNPGALRAPPILFAEESLPVPLLRDADGDGFLDLLYYHAGEIRLHRYRKETEGPAYASQADHTLPLASDADWDIRNLELIDAGGSEAVDLMVIRSENTSTDYLTPDWEILLFHDAFAKGRKLGQPQALLKLEASWLEAYLVQLDGNELLDLGVSAWNLDVPTFFGGKVSIEHKVSLYLAESEGDYARKAVASYDREYSADDFTPFGRTPALAADFNGDGLTDLLEPDAGGRLEILPLRLRKSKPRFADDPSRRVEVNALQSVVEVEQINQDGIGDLIIAQAEPPQLEIYLSRRRP
ncbi:MAG: hypothetical protein DWQ01_14640 [Planctomycetota bacterium]|nr:MAG: hypothetical protein DWQ01_14640 [Planctomycetota bacterium]